MKRRKTYGYLAMLLVLALVGSACGGGDDGPEDDPTDGATDQVTKGGVYRTAVEDFGFTGAFDPTGEYLTLGFALFGQMLTRNLVTYKHVAGGEGDEIVADLVTEVPEPSEDGLSWEFTLKDGVKFGPPLSREITSADVEFAFRRIDHAPLVAQYGFYYDGIIEGMDGPQDELPADITGIETPDDKTVIFNLQQPTGDFLFRLAMPAADPMPE